ncbi:MAG: PEGA domain-containing protein [Chitinivibrionales bacterium]|nr:PEGA domain-containing protein [Chitinivibrionales bacterium]MBD3396844.1 PEGA domain-containing protein [Chitinivibrionales bacterium]
MPDFGGPGGAGMQPPAERPAPAFDTPETRRPGPQPVADFEIGERPARKPPEPKEPSPRRRPSEEERFPRRDVFDEDVKPKKFPVGALVVILLVLIVGGAAYYGVTQGLIKLPGIPGQKPSSEMEEPSGIPQLDVEDSEAQEKEEEALAKEDEEEAEEQEPEVSKPKPTPRRTARRSTRSTPKRSVSRPAPRPAAPAPSRTATSSNNKLYVTSLPPGATVKIDGEVKGTTPYAWDNPSIYGSMTIQVEKPGYEDKSKSMEYTGGVAKEHFVLEQEAPTSTVRTSPPPPASQPEPEPAPAPSAPPQAPQAAAQPPAASAPSPAPSEPKGEPGTIFIASIPPVADVYMDGVRIGKTNVEELKVRSGTHTMKFVKGAKEITKQMTFKPGKNASQMVRIP